MAWYPDAVRKPLTVPNRARNKVRMPRPVRINFHTAVSNSTSIFGFFNSADARGVFSHFYVRKDGTVEQYQDTAYTAACDLDGNADTISIETWDGYRTGYPGYWKHDTDVPPWNPAQVEALTKLSRWIVRTHPTIPARLATDNRRGPSSHGFSWHRLGVVGAPGFVSRIDGGLTYSLARGKVCPGTRRTNQIPAILKAATSAVASAPTPQGDISMADALSLEKQIAELKTLLTNPKTTTGVPYVSAQVRSVAELVIAGDSKTVAAINALDIGGEVRAAASSIGVPGVDADRLADDLMARIGRKLAA